MLLKNLSGCAKRYARFPSSNTLRVFSNRKMSDKSLIGVIQLNSGYDIECNWNTINRLVRECKKSAPNVKMIFLPECFDYIGRTKEETVQNAHAEDDDYIQRYRSLACELDIWLSLGGFHEKFNDTKVRNSHLIIGSDGRTKAKYRKLHLFDIDIPGKVRVKETDVTVAGDSITLPVPTPCGILGLSTCYDLRFPHLSSILRSSGAQILTYPSAFTVTSGMDHWEVLLRSRAITTQCYVVAAAQTGQHNEKRSSFGHSMVVDPWGAIVAQCNEGVGYCLASIDLDYLSKVRTSLPCFDHRRLDLYDAPPLNDEKFFDPDQSATYTFGQVVIPSAHVFLLSRLSYAFVNIKPVLPGHVLVSPLRIVEKFVDLTDMELSDIFKCVRLIEMKLEKLYNVTSTTLCVQDGPDAGQSINHVHVHIIPRQKGDFGDEIYRKIATHDKEKKGQRTKEEMSNEASELRKLFY